MILSMLKTRSTLSADHNMCLHDGIIGMFDFQWTGKACVGKDIAYCLICASGSRWVSAKGVH